MATSKTDLYNSIPKIFINKQRHMEDMLESIFLSVREDTEGVVNHSSSSEEAVVVDSLLAGQSSVRAGVHQPPTESKDIIFNVETEKRPFFILQLFFQRQPNCVVL